MSNVPEVRDFDVVTFGESMGLFYPAGPRGIGEGGSMTQSFGGAESNAAIALARLGCKAGWFGKLGNDPLGRGILKTIRGEGVDVSRALLTEEAPTGLMLREIVRGRMSVYYYRKNSAASLLGPADLDEGYIRRAKILHITGITPALSESSKAAVFHAVRTAKQAGVRISFDPNLRLKLWSVDEARPVLWQLAEEADYFLPGLDELKLLCGTDHEQQLLARIRQLKALTVVKSGGEQNWIVTPDDVVKLPFERIPRFVDPVGAGDGFCAGFLAGISKGWSAERAVRLGGIVGALTVQQEGDWESLPTWQEVERSLHEIPHVER